VVADCSGVVGFLLTAGAGGILDKGSARGGLAVNVIES
jgi:hypothetical protein